MTQPDLFTNCVRSDGRLAGVFEYDGRTGYFYLYDLQASAHSRVLGTIHVVSGPWDFDAADIEIRWDAAEAIVGLLIRGQAWIAFDTRNGSKYGGGYAAGAAPELPSDIRAALSRS